MTPIAGLEGTGAVRVGFLLMAELEMKGVIMDTKFPVTATAAFNKFPLNVRFGY